MRDSGTVLAGVCVMLLEFVALGYSMTSPDWCTSGSVGMCVGCEPSVDRFEGSHIWTGFVVDIRR